MYAFGARGPTALRRHDAWQESRGRWPPSEQVSLPESTDETPARSLTMCRPPNRMPNLQLLLKPLLAVLTAGENGSSRASPRRRRSGRATCSGEDAGPADARLLTPATRRRARSGNTVDPRTRRGYLQRRPGDVERRTVPDIRRRLSEKKAGVRDVCGMIARLLSHLLLMGLPGLGLSADWRVRKDEVDMVPQSLDRSTHRIRMRQTAITNNDAST